MREFRTYGFVGGASGNRCSYPDINKLIKHAPIIWWVFCASACDEQRFPGIGRVEGQSGVSERITRTV